MSASLPADERDIIRDMIKYFFPNDNIMSWSATYARDGKLFGRCVFCKEEIDFTGNNNLLKDHIRIHIKEWNKMKAFV